MEKLSNDVAYRTLFRYSRARTLTYTSLFATTWALSVTASICCAVTRFPSAKATLLWDQNYMHPTAFTMNSIVGSLYWINLFLRQLFCIGSAIVSPNSSFAEAIVSTGEHLIVFNLLHFAFVILFVFSQFAGAEVMVILNFVNMSALYFRYHHYPLFIHSSLVSGPLAWTFFALYWNGFIIPHESNLVRVIGAIFIWAILSYGFVFVYAYKDFTMCLFLSILAASVGLYHAKAQSELYQCIPPFVIAATLFSAAVVINVLNWRKRTATQIIELYENTGREANAVI